MYHLINTTTEISGSMLQCNSTYLILVFQYVIYPNHFILNTIINKEYDIFIGFKLEIELDISQKAYAVKYISFR